MSGFNETKIQVLLFLASSPDSTVLEVSSELGMSSEGISMCLLRCFRWGLVARHREPGEGKTLYYSISNRGLERLNWLISQQE